MKQLLHSMFATNKENLLKHQEVSKYCKNDSRFDCGKLIRMLSLYYHKLVEKIEENKEEKNI